VHLLAFFGLSLGNLLGALVVSRSRVAALLLGLVSIVAPLELSRDWPIFRTFVAFGFAAGYLRVLQLVWSTDGTTTSSRVLAVTCLIIDPRRTKRLPHVVKVDAFVAGAVEMAVAAGLFLMPNPVHAEGWQRSALRILLGGCSAYFIVEGVARFVEGLVGVFGVDAGPFHDAPIRARTVGDFWGRRWNRAIHAWLSEFAFRPTAKRIGAAMGILAAFGASALLHAIPITVALDWSHAVPMGAFFLLHGVIVLVESWLGVSRWPHVLGHMWTLGVFAVTMPLFVDPLLASLGR
jgi:Membrane bound O-acyl transferase family